MLHQLLNDDTTAEVIKTTTETQIYEEKAQFPFSCYVGGCHTSTESASQRVREDTVRTVHL